MTNTAAQQLKTSMFVRSWGLALNSTSHVLSAYTLRTAGVYAGMLTLSFCRRDNILARGEISGCLRLKWDSSYPGAVPVAL